jgi:hypothetical protein
MVEKEPQLVLSSAGFWQLLSLVVQNPSSSSSLFRARFEYCNKQYFVTLVSHVCPNKTPNEKE